MPSKTTNRTTILYIRKTPLAVLRNPGSVYETINPMSVLGVVVYLQKFIDLIVRKQQLPPI